MEKLTINSKEFNEQKALADKLLSSVNWRSNLVKTQDSVDSYITLKEEFDKKVSSKEEFVGILREKGDDLLADFIEKIFLAS